MSLTYTVVYNLLYAKYNTAYNFYFYPQKYSHVLSKISVPNFVLQLWKRIFLQSCKTESETESLNLSL